MKIRSPYLSQMMSMVIAVGFLSLTACNSEAENTNVSEAPAGVSKAPAPIEKATEADHKAAADNIMEKLVAANENIRVRSIQPSKIPGLYEVQIIGKGIIYMEKAGGYFIDGKMLQIVGKEVVNITDKSMVGLRADLMAGVKKEDSIVFSPAGEVKASVAVFTDVDCGYCQKLHKEVPALNEMGIEVRYLAYPRAGINSNSYRKIASAWCASDRQAAMTKLKQREEIAENVCEGNPVAAQYELGQQIGLTGTPAIVLDNGELIPGYMPAKSLAERIGVQL